MTKILSEIVRLEDKLAKTKLPDELLAKAAGMIERLRLSFELGGAIVEFDRVSQYIDWIISIPWFAKVSKTGNLEQAAKILNSNHYGLTEIKERILEYLAVLILKSEDNQELRAPILCFVGLVGTGKTTLAASIAQSLGRTFWRIPFGGMGGAANLRGQSRVYPDAEPGQTVKALRRVGVANPVLLLDEIDRVAEEQRSEIMGVLVELLDPEQNAAFLDHYIDFPIDLSQVLFITTANNTSNIATAVLDRLEVIQMPSYTDSEKIIIGKKYILPKAISETGLSQIQVDFDEEVWPKIVRPLGFDPGMRSLERTVYGICRKIAKLVLTEKVKSVQIEPTNLSRFIPSW